MMADLGSFATRFIVFVIGVVRNLLLAAADAAGRLSNYPVILLRKYETNNPVTYKIRKYVTNNPKKYKRSYNAS